MNLDTLLSDTAQVPDPSPRVLDLGRARLDVAVREHQSMKARRRSRRIRLTAAAGITAAAAVIVPVAVNGGSATTHADAASTVLHAAAAAAGRQSGGWPHAHYWYAVSNYSGATGRVWHRQVWISRTGISVLNDPGVFPNGVVQLGPAQFNIGDSILTWAQLYALPTDPAALKTILRKDAAGSGGGVDYAVFNAIGQLLEESPASPSLRKALYEVTATIPGTKAVGRVTDRDGRTGEGIRRGDVTYTVDPKTGRLLQISSRDWTSTALTQRPSNAAPPAKCFIDKKGFLQAAQCGDH